MDPEALESTVGLVQARLPESDCLIVNKFGKHEADGRGFWTVIGEALALELPVLVGLNALNAEAFMEFSGGLATKIAPNAHEIERWLFGSIAARRDVAC